MYSLLCVRRRSFHRTCSGRGPRGEEHDETGARVHETHAVNVAFGEARREVHEVDGENRDASEQRERAARPTQKCESVLRAGS